MAILRNVQGSVGGGVTIGVQHAEDVLGGRSVHNGRGDNLVHCFVVRGVGGVVDETSAAAIHGAGEEGHAK